jgi:hypothetical protein
MLKSDKAVPHLLTRSRRTGPWHAVTTFNISTVEHVLGAGRRVYSSAGAAGDFRRRHPLELQRPLIGAATAVRQIAIPRPTPGINHCALSLSSKTLPARQTCAGSAVDGVQRDLAATESAILWMLRWFGRRSPAKGRHSPLLVSICRPES